ncbi:hypothetical protein LOTGIDRAFT_176232, partial [Lottia gigantea]
DESEDYVAHMWRRVALSSKVTAEQLSSYQNAIEALTVKCRIYLVKDRLPSRVLSVVSVESNWLKIDYLLEFSQWLYVNMMFVVQCIIYISECRIYLVKDRLPSRVLSVVSVESNWLKIDYLLEFSQWLYVNMMFVVQCIIYISECRIYLVKDRLPSRVLSVVSVESNWLKIDYLLEFSQWLYVNMMFVDESEDYVAHMWRRVALSSKVTAEQLSSYQNAIEALTVKCRIYLVKDRLPSRVLSVVSVESNWLKIDYLLEFSQWLYVNMMFVSVESNWLKIDYLLEFSQWLYINQFPIEDSIDQLLTSHYLEELTEELRALGYNHLSLPVLAFQDLMARGIFNNKAMSNLYHIKSLEVCYELDIKTGCLFHEKAVGNMEISEEEQARSRDEIAIWKEKQVQVAREELRVKESLVRLATEGKIEKRSLTSKTMNSPNKEEKLETVQHLEDNKKEKKKGRMSAKKPKTPELEKPVIETVDIKSEKAESEKEIKAEDYVPVVKQADIGHTLFFVLDICVGPVFLCILGVLPRDMNLTIEDLTDIQQLDYLFRAHVILAQIHGRGSPCYKDTLLTAYSYLQRIWQLVEDYIRETPKYTHMEKDWVEIKQSVGEEAMLLLINSHSLAGNIIPLRTQSLLSIGKCLHLLGQSLHPNPPSQWLNKHM